jgi:tRNA (guanine-N7-)-methyltransferase
VRDNLPVSDAVRPARPHHKLTDDGRPMREVLTYARRGSRFTPRQRQAWDEYADRWWIADERVDQPGFTLAGCFDTAQPLIVEIGSGIGEATVALAATRPSYNVLAFEVWRPGVADTLGRIGSTGLGNVRMISVDAVWSMENLVGEGELAGLWTFFPDPWHKKRHHKRRLVTPEFARLAATRLGPGAPWRLATDWADYAEQMVEVLDAEPLLDGGVVERWDERPVTKFERKGLAEERLITDLLYRRRA